MKLVYFYYTSGMFQPMRDEFHVPPMISQSSYKKYEFNFLSVHMNIIWLTYMEFSNIYLYKKKRENEKSLAINEN
jgi:hypothetical protein